MRTVKRIARLVLAGLGLSVAHALACPATDVQLATFNIELFLHERTDLAAVADTIAQTDADVMAVQEIRDAGMLMLALGRASERTGRDLVLVTSECGKGTWFALGLVYDAARWKLVDAREYPALDPDRREGCRRGWSSGLLGVFENSRGERFAALSVHLRAHSGQFGTRQKQWKRALTIVRDVEAELGVTTVLLGDMNSTGFTGEPAEEATFVRRIIAERGYDLLTDEIPCTEYWQPPRETHYLPSVLDHIVATDGAWKEPEVGGYCARLACRRVPAGDMDPDFHRVSDHCPVRVSGTLD